jgi:hypothetical protein
MGADALLLRRQTGLKVDDLLRVASGGRGRGAETTVVFTAKVPDRLAAAAPICPRPRSRSMPESPLGFHLQPGPARHIATVPHPPRRILLAAARREMRTVANQVQRVECVTYRVPDTQRPAGQIAVASYTDRGGSSGDWARSHIERSNVVFSTASSGEITMADRPDRRDYSACQYNPDECRQCDIAYDRAVSGAARLYLIELPKAAVPARTTPVGAPEGRNIFCDSKCHKHYA